MLVRELLPQFPDVARIVDVSPGTVDLRRHLMPPRDMPYTTAVPADAAALTADTLLVCLVGPQEGTHTPVADLAPVLGALPVGAPVLILTGWTPETLPAGSLLEPLVEGRCQLTAAVPVERSRRHGLRTALLARRVDTLLPPPDTAAGTDALAVQLRMADRLVLGELVDVPVHRRAGELQARVAELEAELAAAGETAAGLRATLARRDRELAKTRGRVRTLETSSSFRLGRTLVDGAKHPGKAVVTVPVNLAKIWRAHRAGDAPATPAPAAPAKRKAASHRTVTIPVPGQPQRALSITAPVALLVPRQLAKNGLAGYEASALPCFLAALDTAGPGAVLDIGANVGLYAALAAAVTDREVVAFEPLPALAEVAERFCAENDLEFRVESMALGRETGTATLYVSDSSDSSNSLAAGFRESSRQIEVPVATLDDYVERSGAVPAVIKIDTETTEPDVILGAARTLREHRPWVLCEVLAGRVEKRLTEALAPHGYTWFPVTDEVPYRAATVIEGDRTYRHLMWLFAPEPPDEAFWAAVTAHRRAIVEAGQP